MHDSIGFIGVGHLAEFMIRGLRRGGYKGDIFITPRSKSKADMLAKQCHCTIASVEQIVAQCTHIGLAVRPPQVEATLPALSLQPHHILVSYIAGMTIEQIQSLMQGSNNVVRAMPISAAAVCSSPTMIFPANAEVQQVLDFCGKTVVFKQESDFDAGGAVACAYASMLEYCGCLSDNLAALGIDTDTSRQVMYGVLQGALDLSKDDLAVNAHDLANEVAVEGSYSKIHLDQLKQANAFQPWAEAMQAIYDKLTI